MANAIYPLWKQAVLNGDSGTGLNGTVKVALIDTDTTGYSASHEFYSSVSSAVVGTPATLNNKTFTNGTLKGDNVTFTAVTGNTVEAIIIYNDSGSAATSRLVAFLDTDITGLTLTPSGTDVTISWNASGIFTL